MPLSVSSATPNKPCHVERSEVSHALVARCFAALNMTDGCSPFYAPQRRTYMKVWKVCALAGAHKLSTFSRNRLRSQARRTNMRPQSYPYRSHPYAGRNPGPPVLLEREERRQAGRFQKLFSKYRVLLLIAITLLSLFAIGLVRLYDPQSPTLLFLDMGPMQSQQ